MKTITLRIEDRFETTIRKMAAAFTELPTDAVTFCCCGSVLPVRGYGPLWFELGEGPDNLRAVACGLAAGLVSTRFGVMLKSEPEAAMAGLHAVRSAIEGNSLGIGNDFGDAMVNLPVREPEGKG